MLSHLNETQRLLRASAEQFANTQSAQSKRSSANDSWKTIAKLGWTGAVLPEQFGGAGGSLVEAGLIAKELGRGGVFSAFVDTAAAGYVLSSMALSADVQTLLLGVSKGEVELLIPTPLEDDEGFVVAPGGAPRTVIVAFKADERPRIVIVELDRQKHQPLKTTSLSGQLHLQDIDDSAGLILIEGRSAIQTWEKMQIALRLMCSIQLIGAARKLLSLSVDYSRMRVQFGKPIGAFQAVQHTLVDLLSALDGAELLLAKVLHAPLELTPDQAVMSAIAFTKESVWRGMLIAYNVLGGVGFMEEHPLVFYTREMLPVLARLGTSSTLHENIAETVRPGAWL